MTKKVKDTMTASLNRIQRQLESVPQEAFKVWVENTPKADGNARRKTRLVGSTIEANYPYAKRLDEGSSKQAPRGMSKPTLEHIEKFVKRNLRK